MITYVADTAHYNEVLSRVTAFATHNEEWAAEDNRRSGLMLESMRLLNRPRDIKQYVTIF